jgi:O-antigen/teichoic acid export membrane protein
VSAGDPSPYRLDSIRSAVGHYLLGRGASAVAVLVSAVLLVRHMSVPDYAGYTAVMGIAGIVGMLASLGIERVVTRFVPEGRLSQSARSLATLVWCTLAVRLAATGLFAACLAVAWPWVIRWFEFVTLGQFPLPLGVFLLATTTLALASTVLQALVRQRLLTRISVLQWGGRLAWIILLVRQGGSISLEQALWVMALPELAGVAAMLVGLRYALKSSTDAECDGASTWPDWHEVWYLAKHSYGYNILASLPQGYLMRTLVGATLPVETVAAYGFFSNLAGRLRMYLPMQLMYNLLEPVLVARYLESKDIGALTRNARLIYSANLLILSSALVFVLIGGSELASVLTKGRLVDQSWILTLVLVQMTMGSQVFAKQLILNVLKENQLMSRASAYGLAAMLLFLGAVIFWFNMYWILFAPLVYGVTVDVVSMSMIREKGIPYASPFREYSAVIGVAMFVILCIHVFLNLLPSSGNILVFSAATLGAVLFTLLSVRFKIIDVKDLARLMSQMKGRRKAWPNSNKK